MQTGKGAGLLHWTIIYIFEQASAVIAPYKVAVKKATAATAPDWWATYQVGQRMSDKFSLIAANTS
jgi:phenol 2-monooxygenase